MRTRLLGFIAAVILAGLGAAAPVVQAAVPAIDGQRCMDGGGSVEYESAKGSWICVDGSYNGKPID
ncbi:hypothetical protein BCL76_101617 [Streptomyces sp. CG 926]|uniref:hypothetical protein n=1 Tax=Streptomyces sp. CG 926 TaxID=1882405 RepID=UPI000D79C712|nr:hypothetical protein [Streptomyces sp. CG 926]PWK74883.1 hypothetical protein BCL76_101617 [Streptomyces sp. CG 926]